MLKKRLSSIARGRGGSRRNERVSSADAACSQQQQSARVAAPSAQSRNMFCSSPTHTRPTNDADGGMQQPRNRDGTDNICDDGGVPLSSPPKYEELFGSKDREGTDGNKSSYSENQNATKNSSVSGVDHVTIFKIRSDAQPEKVEAFFAAARSLAYRIDGVLSLSIGKIFVDDTFMEDKSNGLAKQGGYAMRVRLRDMEAYRGWVESEARKQVVIEQAIPLMPPTSVHTAVAFQSEEIVRAERIQCSGVDHVTIFKIRSDAQPEKVEAFFAAARSLAYRIDGVLSLSIGKIFVDDTFMEDKSNGLAKQGGYAMRVRLRDMEAYRGWVESEPRWEELAIPLMPPTSVPTVVVFQSEEIVGAENIP